jgi:sialate O-acetylesterase
MLEFMKMRNISLFLLALALPGAALSTRAEVTLYPLFADNAVLQQNMKVPIWGSSEPLEHIVIEFAGQSVVVDAGKDGKWKAYFKPMKAGGPYTMTIQGVNTLKLTNVMVGEVWLASGQSNMERHLGLQTGQKPILGWQDEVRDANYPEIRQFHVGRKTAMTPQTNVQGNWSVCSPDTVQDFSAVGYFFARDIHRARHVAVGLIHSSWGGTPAEAWTSEDGLHRMADSGPLSDLARYKADPDRGRREYQAKLDGWYQGNDLGSTVDKPWNGRDVDMSKWKPMTLPTYWESAGEPDLDGVVWFRKIVDLPETFTNGPAELDLGMIDDIDTTWVNGIQVGSMNGYNLVRKYTVGAGILKPGHNTIAVRVLDTGAGGGIYGDKPQLVLNDWSPPIDLSGPWQYRVGLNLKNSPKLPVNTVQESSIPTTLYNGMIAPLVPYGIRGVIWYQGEANVGREKQYRSLFPALIADWRDAWDEGPFPFLFVQIAPYQGSSPEIREAQFLTWQRTKKTAMAVTIDCGDIYDIHPADKRPVGERLAIAARAVAYGEKIEYSGPVYDSMSIKGRDVVLHFTHRGGGLVAKDGALRSFTISGDDKVFHPARAEIRGDTVVVHSEVVTDPVAVHYSWSKAPDGNLFNKAGLPATPFRTDEE